MATRSAGDSLRSDARANQDRVLEAAAKAFARDGANASLRSIAREADVGIATLYRRFPSRELLVEAVYRSESQRLCDSGALLLQKLPPLEALTTWMGEFLEYLAAKSGMAETLRALLTTDEGLRLQTRGMLIKTCGQLLDAAAATGGVRRDIDPVDVVMALGGFAFIAEEQARPDLRQRLLDLLLDGLRT
jgi:AcrR family transcriptional regulator